MLSADVKKLMSSFSAGRIHLSFLNPAKIRSGTKRSGRRHLQWGTASEQSLAILELETLEQRALLSAVTATLKASADTTIYENDPLAGNGAGQFLVTGGGVRSLVRFDVASAVPAGSTVLDAVLTLNLGETDGSSESVGILPVSRAWGEATSDAPGNEHTGAPAAPFDATWKYAFYDGAQWSTPGGDLGSLSASANVSGVGSYEWFSQELTSNVQTWVDHAASNFGWAIAALNQNLNFKSFASKDSPGAVLAPTLEITYEPPPGPPQIVEGRLWNDVNGDGIRSDPALENLDLTLVGGNDYFNVFGGDEYWLKSETNGSWYFLTEDGKLTQWTGSVGQLVGNVIATLDPVYYLQPTLLLQDNHPPEEWLDGWTIELLNADGNVVESTVTAGRDLDSSGAIESEFEGGFYRFVVTSDDEFTVRQVVPGSWSETVRIELESSSSSEKAVNSLKLYQKGSYHQNFGGQNEKWVFSDSNGWHFVTPDGRLLAWNHQKITDDNPLDGTLIVVVGSAAWEDPTVLFDGNFSSQQESEESELVRVDFGNQATHTVKGRVWLDFFENGKRDSIQLIPNYYALYPDENLSAGEEWFYNYNNDDWYVIDANGLPTYWGINENDGDDFDRPGNGGNFGEFIESEIEPWVNTRTVQLIDAYGTVVATTQSKSVDWDQNGAINFESERGWYVFEDVPVGEYVVRTVTNDDWKQTAPVIDATSDVIQLSREHGLFQTGNDFLNWGGKNERWVRGNGREWYYILQNGEVFHWDHSSGQGGVELTGTKIATLNSSYYSQLDLLTNPDTSKVTVNVTPNEASIELLFGNHQLLDSILDYGT